MKIPKEELESFLNSAAPTSGLTWRQWFGGAILNLLKNHIAWVIEGRIERRDPEFQAIVWERLESALNTKNPAPSMSPEEFGVWLDSLAED